MAEKDFSKTEFPPTVKKWIVTDDFDNEVKEGDSVFILAGGETIHEGAIEDYLIEKLQAKFATLNSDGEEVSVIVLPGDKIVREDAIEDFFIEDLGAQIYERKKPPLARNK